MPHFSAGRKVFNKVGDIPFFQDIVFILPSFLLFCLNNHYLTHFSKYFGAEKCGANQDTNVNITLKANLFKVYVHCTPQKIQTNSITKVQRLADKEENGPRYNNILGFSSKMF